MNGIIDGLTNGQPVQGQPMQPEQPMQPGHPTQQGMLAPGIRPEGQPATEEEQELFSRYEINTINMLHGEKPKKQFLGLLNPGQPVKSVAIAATKLLDESRAATFKKGGKPVTPEMNNKAARTAVGELSALAEASGKFTLDDNQKREALKMVIGTKYKTDVKSGALSPDSFKQFLQESGAMDQTMAELKGKVESGMGGNPEPQGGR